MMVAGETNFLPGLLRRLRHSCSHHEGDMNFTDPSNAWPSLSSLSSNSTTMDSSSSTTTSDGMSTAFFWVATIMVTSLVVLACTWMWCCRGVDRMTISMAHSEEQYRQHLARRQQQLAEQRAKEGETPSERKLRVLQSFQQVRMIVQEGDLIAPGAAPPESREEAEVLPPPVPVNDAEEVVSKENKDSSSQDSLPDLETGLSTGPIKTTEDQQLDLMPLKKDQSQMVAGDAVSSSTITAPEASPPSLGPESMPSEPPHIQDGDFAVMASNSAALPDNLDEHNSMTNSEDHDTGYLLLRAAAASPDGQAAPPRQVPNCCAICLGPYQVGESIVWSSNRSCPHAFHEECMLDWLCHQEQLPRRGPASPSTTSTSCPCCRQNFTDLAAFRRQRRVTWDAQKAFDFRAIGF